jgi:hypothetical protein
MFVFSFSFFVVGIFLRLTRQKGINEPRDLRVKNGPGDFQGRYLTLVLK